MMYRYLLLFIAAAIPVTSFVATTPAVSCSRATKQSTLLIHRRVPTTTTTTTTSLQLKRLGYNNLSTKEFQLEELEDKDECESILWLNNDGSVTLGTTNGPQYSNYKGSWNVHGEGGKEFSVDSGSVDSNEYPFRMKLIRSYDSTTMDDVAYDIVREFWGNIEMVGGSVSVSGKIHDSTSNAGVRMEVGYFTLIDSAASEEEIDGAASAHPSGDGITSYLSDLGSSSSLSGSGMPSSYLDSIGDTAMSGGATSNDTPPSSLPTISTPSTSSTVDVDTQVTRDGDKTIITIKSVSTVRIQKE